MYDADRGRLLILVWSVKDHVTQTVYANQIPRCPISSQIRWRQTYSIHQLDTINVFLPSDPQATQRPPQSTTHANMSICYYDTVISNLLQPNGFFHLVSADKTRLRSHTEVKDLQTPANPVAPPTQPSKHPERSPSSTFIEEVLRTAWR